MAKVVLSMTLTRRAERINELLAEMDGSDSVFLEELADRMEERVAYLRREAGSTPKSGRLIDAS